MNDTVMLVNENVKHEVLRRQILVVECTIIMHAEEMEILRNGILRQIKDEGVVILPSYCKAVIVDADTAVGFVDGGAIGDPMEDDLK